MAIRSVVVHCCTRMQRGTHEIHISSSSVRWLLRFPPLRSLLSFGVVIVWWRGSREMGQSGRVRERASFVRRGGGLAQFGHIMQGVSPSSCAGGLGVYSRRISSGVKVGLGATTTPIPFSRKCRSNRGRRRQGTRPMGQFRKWDDGKSVAARTSRNHPNSLAPHFGSLPRSSHSRPRRRQKTNS